MKKTLTTIKKIPVKFRKGYKLEVARNQFANAASKKDNECLLLLNMRRKLISAVTFYYPTQTGALELGVV